MDLEQFRKAGYEAIDRICELHASLGDKPVCSQVEPGYLREALPSGPPELGEDFGSIAQDYDKLIVPGLTHWQHPSFFAYFPTGCTFEGILGDLYASATPNPGFNWACSPACTELEAIVMDWSAKLFGLSEEFLNTSGVGGGVLQTTASDSALVAVVAARSLFARRNPSASAESFVIYTTTQTHSLGKKAALILGVQCRALDVTPEDKFALRGDTLRKALAEDKAAGRHPFILIATVGTTSSGAVDRIDEIGEVLRENPNIWLHVDAAWAGVTLACPEFREQAYLSAINEYATSFCTNFHKWGLVNFDASTLWVRDRKNLTDALDVTPEFLRTKQGDEGTVIDYRNWHLSLGRRFRSLKIWFVLRSYGVSGFQSYIRKGIDMSDVFVSLIRGSDLFTLVTEPSLALSVFRLAPSSHANASLQELNALNKALHARLSARSAELYLTQTDLNGVFCFRMAIGASRTEEHHVRRAFDVLEEEARIVLSGNGSIPGHAASTELGGGVQESTMAQVTKET